MRTLTDAAQHIPGQKLFCKLDFSQAYHCLQMADYQSIEMLAFNFASRTIACKLLAQGLNLISPYVTTSNCNLSRLTYNHRVWQKKPDLLYIYTLRQVVDEKEQWEIKKTCNVRSWNQYIIMNKKKEVSEVQQYHHPTAGTYQHKFGHFKDNSKIRIEQNNATQCSEICVIWFEKQSINENEFKSDSRHSHYLAKISSFRD